ncbi:MAG TPA: hypothetical protein DDZ51_21355 [Planctomycetaceae bacterium]|nr:hypothetical protein [Planctomycetaceae bacterium]
MAVNTKIDERRMLAHLRPGEPLLPPLVIRKFDRPNDREIDALVDVSFPTDLATERFSVECNTRSTPEVFRKAIRKASDNAARFESHPMVFLPYLSPEKLAKLEELAVSGIDLCGNGFIYVPNRMCVARTGNPNLYPDSRPIANPYRGRSSLVARMLLNHPHWDSLGQLTEAIKKETQTKGLSLSQVSKTIAAFAEDLIVTKTGNQIALTDPVRLLDNLGSEWRRRSSLNRHAYRSSHAKLDLRELVSVDELAWSLSGESSAPRYCTIAQGGPVQLIVNNLKLAESTLSLIPESVPSFADIVLMESEEDEYYFANERDEAGVRYASRVQTWLELNAGDARQRETAKDLYQTIIRKSRV